jgi:hypothetical protein
MLIFVTGSKEWRRIWFTAGCAGNKTDTFILFLLQHVREEQHKLHSGLEPVTLFLLPFFLIYGLDFVVIRTSKQVFIRLICMSSVCIGTTHRNMGTGFAYNKCFSLCSISNLRTFSLIQRTAPDCAENEVVSGLKEQLQTTTTIKENTTQPEWVIFQF